MFAFILFVHMLIHIDYFFSFQIQFLLIIFLGTVVVPLTECKVGIFTYVANICFVPLFLYLFFKFYMEAYQPTTKSKDVEMNSNKLENGYSFPGKKDEWKRIINIFSKTVLQSFFLYLNNTCKYLFQNTGVSNYFG